ncbi:hypothetical protein QJS10_CPB11g01133 [Acorus calamus]|uniref:Uncharacterized protein n=1 Tax=Acorus calamus TaxID=4465 RepID=A0AAV9DRI3_ACOCL|nr:hypothetical protein QJS10_CPB11g01133 [Acorus calamus]
MVITCNAENQDSPNIKWEDEASDIRKMSSEAAEKDDDGAAKEAAERLTRASSFPQRRTPSAHWRPTLGAISEDGVLGSASASASATTGAGGGAGGGSRAKRSTEGRCGRTARIRPRKQKDNLRYVGIALPAFTPTAFMF